MIIIALILLYGYNAIKGFRERQDTVSQIEIENQIRNTIKTMSSEYDSIKKAEMQLPSKNSMICFIDTEALGTTLNTCTYGASNIAASSQQKIINSWEIIKDSVKDKTANIFLVPDATENYLIGNIQLDNNNCLCIEKQGTQATFKVTGLGNGVKIGTWT